MAETSQFPALLFLEQIAAPHPLWVASFEETGSSLSRKQQTKFLIHTLDINKRDTKLKWALNKFVKIKASTRFVNTLNSFTITHY